MSNLEQDIIRRLGFYFALAYIFIRCSFLHEYVAFKVGRDLYMVYLFAPPALLALILSGGLGRVFRAKPGLFWLAFLFWQIVAIPFSGWPGGSFALVTGYMKTEFTMLLVTGGLLVSVGEARKVMFAIALGGVSTAIMGRFFSQDMGDRLALAMTGGSISNPNDLATHILFTFPFMLYLFLTRGAGTKMAVLAGAALGMWVVLATGSRAGLLALIAGTIFVFFRAHSTTHRVAIFAMLLAVGGISLVRLPDRIVKRYQTLVSDDVTQQELSEAVVSVQSRINLLKRSLWATVSHPIFGVGPGLYADYDAEVARAEGRRAAWQVTHNSYTEVSSGAGIPALIFYLGGIIATYLQLNRIYNETRDRPEFRSIALGAFCMLLALVIYCAATTFTSLAYRHYLLTMAGLATSYTIAARREIEQADTTAGSLQTA